MSPAEPAYCTGTSIAFCAAFSNRAADLPPGLPPTIHRVSLVLAGTHPFNKVFTVYVL